MASLREFYGFRSRFCWVAPLLLLAAVLVLFECFPGWDIRIQDCFYSAERGWLVGGDDDKWLEFCYYQGPKIILIPLFVVLVLYSAWRTIRTRRVPWRHIYVLACLGAIPGVVAALKVGNSMPYPKKLVRYGGTEERRTVVEAFQWSRADGTRHYGGWPGGHASGGFALMGAAFAPEDPRRRRTGFLAATALGFYMGIGHTIDGAHFFSHSLVSFCIAWLVAALLWRLLVMLQEHFQRRRCAG